MTQEQITNVMNIQKRNLEVFALQKRQVTEDNIFGRIAIKLGCATYSQIEERLDIQVKLLNDSF